MNRLGYTSSSDPPDPTLANSTATAKDHVKEESKVTIWSGFNTPPAADLTTTSAFTPPSQDGKTRPALSFGFSAQQKASPTGAQANLRASSTTSVSSFRPSSFGTSSFGAKPGFASSTPGLSFSGQRDFAASASPSYLKPLSQIAQPGVLRGNDPLSKALSRASRNRPAVFGRKDLDADEVIADFCSKSKEVTDVKELVKDLAAVAQTHPIAMSFLQHLFGEASGNYEDLAPARRSIPVMEQIFNQDDLDWRIQSLLFKILGWSGDLCDYIVRMIVFGLPAREIRAAVKTDMDSTHGFNHVSAKEVELLVTWMRGSAADVVRDSRFTGSDFDFFRLSSREKRNVGQVTTAKDGDDHHCASEHRQRCDSKEHKAEGGDPKGRGVSGNEKLQVDKQDEMKFRFMDLPTELRLWVCRSAITPTGYISLRSCAHHLPAGVNPPIVASIFQLSKTINREAEGLLMDNTIIVNGCLEFGSRSAIHRSQLPDHVLPLVNSMVLVVDFTRIMQTARVADWRAAQGLTGLKNLRICGIATVDPKLYLPQWLGTHLRMILERVPAGCTVCFGQDLAGSEVDAHVLDMVGKIRVGGPHVLASAPVTDAYVMEGTVLENAWTAIEKDVVRGRKSGFKQDFRFEDRRANGELDQHWNELRRRQEDDAQPDE